jgi:hypothetical protein
MSFWQLGGLLKNNSMNRISIILHCTENYLQNSLNLVKSLNLYHNNLDFYLYTLNFNHDSNISNLTTVPIGGVDIENNMSFIGNKNDVTNKNMFKSVFFKSKVVLHTIEELKLDQAIYIDFDILPTGEISELFEFIGQVDDYPLIQQSLFEFPINYGRGNPFHKGGFDETNILEYPLMNKHHVPTKNRTHYSVTSVMIYNKSCRQFLKEYDWMNEIAISMDLEDIKYFYPFSDETTMNVLLWKYKYNKRLPFMQMNIDDIGNVKEYYESNYDGEKEITSYVRIPSKNEKKHKLFFHGAKGELSNEIYNLQQNMFNHRLDLNNNKFYISSNFDLKRNIDIIFYDDKDLIYQATINIEKGTEYWFSPNKKFKEVNKLIVKIYDNEKLIFKL